MIQVKNSDSCEHYYHQMAVEIYVGNRNELTLRKNERKKTSFVKLTTDVRFNVDSLNVPRFSVGKFDLIGEILVDG